MKFVGYGKSGMVFSVALLMLYIAAAWTLSKHYQNHKNRTLQLLLLQELKDSSTIQDEQSKRLLSSAGTLNAIQTQQDQTIILFQNVINGDIKRSLPPLHSTLNAAEYSLESLYNTNAALIATIMQQRSTLNQLQESKKAALRSASLLHQNAQNIVQALIKVKAKYKHINMAYNAALELEQHLYRLTNMYDENRPYEPMNLESISRSLNTLSTGSDAPSSTIIKRSSAKLASDLMRFSERVPDIESHHKIQADIIAKIDKLHESNAQFRSALDEHIGALLHTTPVYFYVSILLWMLALVATVGQCISMRKNSFVKTRIKEAPAPIAPSIDTASGRQADQLIMEKNTLLNDIRPLGDGILYIKVDENFESTGDIARCLNESRESLISKVVSLHQSIMKLKLELNTYDVKTDLERVVDSASLDTSSLENLTFQAQAELEGLQRKIVTIRLSHSDEIKSLLAHCQKSDQYLDEIRIRVKKGFKESIQYAVENSAASADKNPDRNQCISRLINEVVTHLDQLQTVSPKSHRKIIN